MERHQTHDKLILQGKVKRPKKQRQAKEILGEGCEGLLLLESLHDSSQLLGAGSSSG